MPPPEPRLLHHVGCRFRFIAVEPSTLALAITVAQHSGHRPSEELTIIADDGSPGSYREIPTSHGGRIHLAELAPGPHEVVYSASVDASRFEPEAHGLTGPIDESVIVALRQSRYCPSDALEGFASATFDATQQTPAEFTRSVAEWVFHRTRYELGSSDTLDTAVDTLLGAKGVCRDFAHLTITLCRALGVPARLAAVYAPGLTPMDFHAVVEVRTEHGWEVLDPTRLAPRHSLVRIATGRDAADTAFATTIRGNVHLESSEVTAVVDGDLPVDDHLMAVHLR